MIYVKNKELKRALAESKEKGQLTRETIEMFTLIVNGMSKTHSYRDYEDREDCISSGIDMTQRNQIMLSLLSVRLHTTV